MEASGTGFVLYNFFSSASLASRGGLFFFYVGFFFRVKRRLVSGEVSEFVYRGL